ncbi:hypothetical protein MRX96_027586 [Rhipicephalus microplus]
MKGTITHVVVESGVDDKRQDSRASSDGSPVAGRKDTCAPEEFSEKEQAEVKPQIAEEGAESIVERHRERLCMVQGLAGPRELGGRK